jgi:phosphoglycolate phosphatase
LKSKVKPANLLIFDFDGTIADTYIVAVDVLKRLLKMGNRRHPTDHASIQRLREMPAREFLKSLGVRWWEMPLLLYYARKMMRERIDQVHAFDGVRDVIRKLHEQDYKLWIVSSNGTKTIEIFLNNNRLNEYFDGFWGNQGVFSKTATLRKLARRFGVRPEDCTYIGDEVRDADAARHAGMNFIGVTWGFNGRKALEKVRVEHLIDKPAQLIPFLKKR